MMAAPRCDLCRNEATYHEGTFHYCERHKPIWLGEGEHKQERPYTPGASGLFDGPPGFDKNRNRKRGR